MIWQNQMINVEKNQPQKSKNQLSSTVSLLCTLLEDLGCAIELHAKLVNEVTELHSLVLKKYLFNGQVEGDDCNKYLFGQGISMKPVVMTRNIYSFMNHGVYLHTESSTKICLQFWMNSVYEHMEERQVSQTDFENTLVCIMMKEYKHI